LLLRAISLPFGSPRVALVSSLPVLLPFFHYTTDSFLPILSFFPFYEPFPGSGVMIVIPCRLPPAVYFSFNPSVPFSLLLAGWAPSLSHRRRGNGPPQMALPSLAWPHERFFLSASCPVHSLLSERSPPRMGNDPPRGRVQSVSPLPQISLP